MLDAIATLPSPSNTVRLVGVPEFDLGAQTGSLAEDCLMLCISVHDHCDL